MLVPAISPVVVQHVAIATAVYEGREIVADRPGGDYRHFEMADARQDLCRASCESEPQCKAFTYVRG